MQLLHVRSRLRRRTVPVWCLLVALALVPTIGMGAFSAREARGSAERADRSARAAADTTDLAHVLNLLFALTDEQMQTQVVLRTGSFGVDLDTASQLIGYDVGARLEAAQDDVDAALVAMPAAIVEEFPELGDAGPSIAEQRRRSAVPGEDPSSIHAAYQAIMRDVQRATHDRTERLVSDGGAVLDPGVAASVQSFGPLISAYTAMNRMVGIGADLLFEPQDRDLFVEVSFAIAEHRLATEALTRAPDPFIRDEWAEIAVRPEVLRIEEATDTMLDDIDWLSAGGTERVAQVFGDTFTRIDLVAELSREGVQRAVARARAAEVEATRAYQRSIALSAAVSLVAVVSVFLVSRSISRPLGLLARRAGQMSEGELSALDAIGAGPTEVQTVARALDDAAGSLRRIGEQAQALAAGRLEDPVLSAAVPGVLGESVHASVEQLSRSLRDQDELRQRLDLQAHHDVLTGLFNRAGFLVAAEKAVARAQRTGNQVAFLFLDLDGFKRANDSHGHRFGDEVLRAMADRLVGVARVGDTVARLGGDEFVLIAEPVGAIGQAVAMGERLIAAVSEPVEIDGRTARMGASVGVATCQDGRETALELLAEADQAVFRAKRAGGGRVEVFDEALRQEAARRNEIEDALRVAIPGGELELHYQPVVAASDGRMQGFEALVRWNRPGHGLVPPFSFIPVAENSDLVVDLGRWVLREATAQLAAWSSEPGLADAHVSVNISGRHLLNTGVVDDVAAALAASGLEPHRLHVEITETVILADMGVAVAHLDAIRALGVLIALDDFGTGYTSIGQLGHLPIDVLKIDRSFVTDLHRRTDRSIVELMVGVAHTLGLGLVAEGVETVEELDVLQQLSCDDIQGYFFSRPLPAADAAAWAAERVVTAPVAGAPA